MIDDVALFESNAIAEYLDETFEPKLHPADPIKRAQNRAWTDFIPTFGWGPGLNNLTYCTSKEALPEAIEMAKQRVSRLENAIAKERGNDGPYFNGNKLCLVDAAYAPFLQRFMIVEGILQTGLLDDFPLVHALLSSDVITGSMASNFVKEFEKTWNAAVRWCGMFYLQVAQRSKPCIKSHSKPPPQ